MGPSVAEHVHVGIEKSKGVCGMVVSSGLSMVDQLPRYGLVLMWRSVLVEHQKQKLYAFRGGHLASSKHRSLSLLVQIYY
jgi:hypothetical protein